MDRNGGVFLHSLIGYAVPVFMLMSFFLSYDMFVSATDAQIKKRLYRLLLPQIGWTAIYWGVYKCINIVFFRDADDMYVSDFFWQLFMGHSPKLNATMWYQVDLILITVLYLLIFRFAKRYAFHVISIVTVAALFMQYSGMNELLFSECRYEIKYPVGRFSEMLPYAALGIALAHLKITDKLKEYRLFAIALIGMLAVLVLKYSVFSGVSGFSYSGLKAVSIALFAVTGSCLLPLQYLPRLIKSFLGQITKYTLGIYCMHRLTARFLSVGLGLAVPGFQTGSIAYCAGIYVISYFISFVIAKIPVKWFRDLVL